MAYSVTVLDSLPLRRNGRVIMCQHEFVGYFHEDEQFFCNGDVIQLSDGCLALCLQHKHCVRILSQNGEEVLREIGSIGRGDALFKVPVAAAQLADGNIVVTDCMNRRLQILTPVGGFIREVLPPTGSFGSPRGVAVLLDGSIAVVDCLRNSVEVFTADWRHARTMGSAGSSPLHFRSPRGIAVLEDGNIVVSDTLNHRLQVFTPEGEFIQAIDVKGHDTQNFLPLEDPPEEPFSPGCLFVLSGGIVVVSDLAAQVFIAFRLEPELLVKGARK